MRTKNFTFLISMLFTAVLSAQTVDDFSNFDTDWTKVDDNSSVIWGRSDDGNLTMQNDWGFAHVDGATKNGVDLQGDFYVELKVKVSAAEDEWPASGFFVGGNIDGVMPKYLFALKRDHQAVDLEGVHADVSDDGTFNPGWIDSYAVPVLDNTTWTILRMEKVGDNIKSYVNGRLVSDQIIAGVTGKLGIMTERATTEFAYIEFGSFTPGTPATGDFANFATEWTTVGLDNAAVDANGVLQISNIGWVNTDRTTKNGLTIDGSRDYDINVKARFVRAIGCCPTIGVFIDDNGDGNPQYLLGLKGENGNQVGIHDINGWYNYDIRVDNLLNREWSDIRIIKRGDIITTCVNGKLVNTGGIYIPNLGGNLCLMADGAVGEFASVTVTYKDDTSTGSFADFATEWTVTGDAVTTVTANDMLFYSNIGWANTEGTLKDGVNLSGDFKVDVEVRLMGQIGAFPTAGFFIDGDFTGNPKFILALKGEGNNIVGYHNDVSWQEWYNVDGLDNYEWTKLTVTCVGSELKAYINDNLVLTKTVSNFGGTLGLFTDGAAAEFKSVTHGDVPTSVQKNIAQSIKMYPNPANDVVTIDADEFQTIEVFNLNGQMILKLNGGKRLTINTSELKEGVYLVRFSNNNTSITQRLIVK